jgi:hypothetical protein
MVYMHQILPRLFVGSDVAATDVPELKRYKIQAILNVDGPALCYTVPKNIVFLHYYIPDGQIIPPPTLDLVLNFIDTQIKAGRNTLVHCAMGISRSPSLIIAYMMIIYPKMSWDQAFREVSRIRPISPAPELKESIIDYFDSKRNVKA